jgi:acetylornithine deacetylase/succinyl-diaminopimelate desuccinylase-like protein
VVVVVVGSGAAVVVVEVDVVGGSVVDVAVAVGPPTCSVAGSDPREQAPSATSAMATATARRVDTIMGIDATSRLDEWAVTSPLHSPAMALRDDVRSFIDQAWDDDIEPTLHDYIRIPNESPAFDPDWEAHGHMAAAVELVRTWWERRLADAGIDDATVTEHTLAGRTPVLVADIPATAGATEAGTVLLYGHLDKQPPMLPWSDGLDPWTPVRRGDRLYGRGSADDGYAVFAALAAVEAVRAGGGEHARCVILIEASEESGSPDLPAHVDALGDRLGSPSLVVCLDSGCATYDRLWVTTSLRGFVGLTVRVDVLTAGVHSGSAGGVVPSSFRVLRQLLDRVEDSSTGELVVPELHAPIPAEREAQLHDAVEAAGDAVGGVFPFVGGVVPTGATAADRLRNRTWRPAVEVIAADGLPVVGHGGNVLRPATTLELVFRLPPTVDARVAADAVRTVLLADPPEGASVAVDVRFAQSGWDAPATAPWLADAVQHASSSAFGQPAAAMGEGGSIPFMGMLGERFPDAQFIVTGVLGPGAGHHGPDEHLMVPYAAGITHAVAHILDAHAHARR